MAAENYELTILVGKKEKIKETQDLKPKFSEVGVGSVTMSDDLGDLSIDKKVKVTAGTDSTHVATKGQLDTESTARSDADSALSLALSTETTNRTNADNALDLAIGTETTNRINGDNNLQGQIDTVAGNLATEISDRGTADGVLQGQITTNSDDIATLQADVASILSNNPAYEKFIPGVGGASVFNLTKFEVDGDNTILDIDLFWNGRWQPLAETGLFVDGAFRKNSTTQVETAETIPEGEEIVVFKRGTATGGGGGGATDLQNITVDLGFTTPKQVGTLAKPAKSVFLKDKSNTDIWEIEVNAGILQAVKRN